MHRCCIFILLLAASGLHAESRQTDAIETIIVTASRLHRGEAANSTSTALLDRDQIEIRNPASVVDLIRQLPGMHVTQQGGRGGLNTIYVRGAESNFTVVMIDGVKVNDSLNARGASYDFSTIALAGISRIELVRGPLSSIYGSDALSGVIQLFTTGGPPGSTASFEVGSAGLRSAEFLLRGGFDGSHGSLDLHATRDDGDVTGSSHEDIGASGAWTADLGESTELSAVVRYQGTDSRSFPENSGGPDLAVRRISDRRATDEGHLRVAIRHAHPDDWHLDLSVSRYERNEDVASPGIAPGALPGVPASSVSNDFTRDQVVAILQKTAGDRLSFALGAEWQRETGNSRGILDLGTPVPADYALDRNTLSAFAEFNLDIGALTLAASVRHDQVDAIGRELSAGIGAVYQFGETEVRARWGEGFKAPGFFALAHPLVGNPDLRSEFAESIEAGVSHKVTPAGSILDISVFRNEYTDLIDFDPDLFTTVNRSRVVTRGFEAALTWPVAAAIELNANLSYVDAEVRSSDTKLGNRPKWRGGIILDWYIGERLHLAASVLAVDEYYDSSIPTATILLDGYERVDVSLTWKPRESLSWKFAVDNLFDADYQEAVGFPAPGARARLGLQLEF